MELIKDWQMEDLLDLDVNYNIMKIAVEKELS